MYTNFIKEDTNKNGFFLLKTQLILLKNEHGRFYSNDYCWVVPLSRFQEFLPYFPDGHFKEKDLLFERTRGIKWGFRFVDICFIHSRYFKSLVALAC